MLHLFSIHMTVMANLLARLSTVLSAKQAEIASLKQQLADALANDAADAAAIEAAKAEATAAATQAQQAQDNATRLQQLVDADTVEDQAISDLLSAYEPSAEPVPEPDSESAPEPVT